jgi:hypothetical protein
LFRRSDTTAKRLYITKSRYTVYRTKYKVKMWGPFLKVIKNFKRMTVENKYSVLLVQPM